MRFVHGALPQKAARPPHDALADEPKRHVAVFVLARVVAQAVGVDGAVKALFQPQKGGAVALF